MALRLDFTPSNFTLIQLDLPVRSLRKSEGGSLRLTISMSISPSLSKSPKAHPRLQCAAATPGPASWMSSSNTPLPRFLKTARGVLLGYCGNVRSTWGRSEEHTSELQSP